MGATILIRAGKITLTAELDDSPSAAEIASHLPIASEAGRWGDEVYFETGITLRLAADARDVLRAGEVAYWPPGKALCIFWGRTPSSQGEEIRAASPVNVIGRVVGDAGVLKDVRAGEAIRVERA
jgi:uncharacterized protein